MNESGPTEWSARYQTGITPWDLGRAHPELVRRLPEIGPPGTVIVPGAGRGHDAAVLAAAGWTVTAIDFAPVLASHLEAAVGERGRVVIGDVFGHHPSRPVDMVFDHTFFCAIPLQLRGEFGHWASRVLRVGGNLVSVVFPLGRPHVQGGPPYGMSTADLREALGPSFVVVVDEPAVEPGRRSFRTRWAVFRNQAL